MDLVRCGVPTCSQVAIRRPKTSLFTWKGDFLPIPLKKISNFLQVKHMFFTSEDMKLGPPNKTKIQKFVRIKRAPLYADVSINILMLFQCDFWDGFGAMLGPKL